MLYECLELVIKLVSSDGETFANQLLTTGYFREYEVFDWGNEMWNFLDSIP